MADITMPQLGETVTEGTITKWFKAVGDTVAEDEPLFEVSTDKVDSEVPSPMAGTLTEIQVPEGETVDVGVVLAVDRRRRAAPRRPRRRPRRRRARAGRRARARSRLPSPRRARARPGAAGAAPAPAPAAAPAAGRRPTARAGCSRRSCAV